MGQIWVLGSLVGCVLLSPLGVGEQLLPDTKSWFVRLGCGWDAASDYWQEAKACHLPQQPHRSLWQTAAGAKTAGDTLWAEFTE